MPDRCPPPPLASGLPDLRCGDLLTTHGLVLIRAYRSRGDHAMHWSQFRRYGPLPTMRFDHHPPPPREDSLRSIYYASRGGSQYVCDPLDIAVLKAFGDTGVIPVSSGSHWLVTWKPLRPLRLLDLSDSTWLARPGATAALTSGPRAVARAWARVIWRAYSDLDGITWASAANPAGSSIALFERAIDAVPEYPALHVPLSHPGLAPALTRIAVNYGMLLA